MFIKYYSTDKNKPMCWVFFCKLSLTSNLLTNERVLWWVSNFFVIKFRNDRLNLNRRGCMSMKIITTINPQQKGGFTFLFTVFNFYKTLWSKLRKILHIIHRYKMHIVVKGDMVQCFQPKTVSLSLHKFLLQITGFYACIRACLSNT